MYEILISVIFILLILASAWIVENDFIFDFLTGISQTDILVQTLISLAVIALYGFFRKFKIVRKAVAGLSS